MSNQQQNKGPSFQIFDVVLVIIGNTLSMAQKIDFYNYLMFKVKGTWICVEAEKTRTIMIPFYYIQSFIPIGHRMDESGPYPDACIKSVRVRPRFEGPGSKAIRCPMGMKLGK